MTSDSIARISARYSVAARPSLFRQEAIDFLHQRHSWGEVVSLQPISSTILSWSLAGLVAFILCFLSIAQYARKETVTGYLTPTFGTGKILRDVASRLADSD